MQTILKILRGLLVGLLGFVLVNAIMVGVFLSSLSLTLTSRTRVENWLTRRAVYDAALAALPQIAQQQLAKENGEGQPAAAEFNPEVLTSKIGEAVSYEKYQRVVHGAVEGVYDWLGGKTQYPEIKLQIAETPEEFLDFLATIFSSKLETLPECTAAEAAALGDNPLEWPCRPPGYTPEAIRQYLQANQGNPELAKLFEKQQNQTIKLFNDPKSGSVIDPAAVERIQRGYHIFAIVPYIFAAVVFGCMLLISLVLWPLRRGLRSAAMVAIWPAGLVLLGALLSWLLLPRLADFLVEQADQPLEAIAPLRLILDAAARDISIFYTSIAAALFALCLALVLLLGRAKPATPEPSHEQ